MARTEEEKKTLEILCRLETGLSLTIQILTSKKTELVRKNRLRWIQDEAVLNQFCIIKLNMKMGAIEREPKSVYETVE